MSDARRPNILYILSDQHARNVLGCYGDGIVRTPNLDKLAAGGVVFDSVYTPSPICVPARMSMLTGKFPFRQRCWTNSDALASDIPTTAHALGAAGYYPTLIGRMHAIGPDQLHGYARREVGDHITDWYGGEPYTLGALDKAQRCFEEAITKSGPGQCSYELIDHEVTKRSLAYLDEIADKRRAGDDTPFALTVGYMLPHQPYVADPELYAYYEGKIGPPRLSRPDAGEATYLELWRAQTGLNDITEPDEIRARTAYYALVETVDRMVGEILERLEALGLAEDTLVVYLSDHGEQIGERDLWWKQTFYEESVTVPLIMRWPGRIPAGTRRGEIVNLVDLSATIVEVAGSEPLPGIDGRSFLPLALGKEMAWPNETFSEFCTDSLLTWAQRVSARNRMIRSGRWKYIYYHGFPAQLFDLETDPDEMTNLAGDPRHAETERALREKLLAEWDPEEIDAYIRARAAPKAILKAWAQSVKPPDSFRWPTRAEDNFIVR